jgi:hypothetical protein
MDGHLRTLCNNNGISCRDSNGNYLSQTKMVQKLSSLRTVQTGGGLGPDKLWGKYSDALIKRLRADTSYKDPLPTKLPDTFQSPNHVKYLEWVVTSYLEGGIKKYEDIQSRAYPALTDYALLLVKKKLQGTETNLLNYCGLSGCSIKSKIRAKVKVRPLKKATTPTPTPTPTPTVVGPSPVETGPKGRKLGLDSLLDKYEDVLSLAKGKAKEHDVGKSVPIFSGEQITVYAPKSEAESQYYGRATKWCTAANKNCMFDHYYSDGPLYIVVPKNPQYKGEKYQLHFASEQYMDEKDDEVNLLELINNYPELLHTALLPLIYDGSDINIHHMNQNPKGEPLHSHMRGGYIIVPKNPKYKGETYQLHFSSTCLGARLRSSLNEKNQKNSLVNLINDYPELLHTALFPLIYDGSDININQINDGPSRANVAPSAAPVVAWRGAACSFERGPTKKEKPRRDPCYIISPKGRQGGIFIIHFSNLNLWELKTLYKKYPEISVIIIKENIDISMFLSLDELSEVDLKYALEHDELILAFKEHKPDEYSVWMSDIVYYVAANDEYEIDSGSYSEVSNAMKKLEVDDFAMRDGEIIFSGEFDHLVGQNITIDDMILTIQKRYQTGVRGAQYQNFD